MATPNLATSELTKRLRNLSREELSQLSPQESAQIDWFLRDQRCAQPVASFSAGPLYWLTTLTKTENEQAEQQGLPFRAPFPKKSYFVPLFAEFLKKHQQLYICKSRTMLTSWSAMGYGAWCAQWRSEEVILQTATEAKAKHLVDYVRALWENQEPWLRERHPLRGRNTFEISWKSGGHFLAVPSGVDQVRSMHPALYIQEESAFLPEGGECLESAVLPSGARVICVSSAAPGWFAEACAR